MTDDQTPNEMTDAEWDEADAAEIQEGSNLVGITMRLFQGRQSLARMRAGAERQRTAAEEQLRLLLDGSVDVGVRHVDASGLDEVAATWQADEHVTRLRPDALQVVEDAERALAQRRERQGLLGPFALQVANGAGARGAVVEHLGQGLVLDHRCSTRM